MVAEEAVSLAAHGKEAARVRLPRLGFRITAGPDVQMAFQLEQGTCRAIGRAAGDPQRTAVFTVDVTLGLEEQVQSLVLRYIASQFQGGTGVQGEGERLGQFRRAPDVVLTDPGLSRLHAMVFAHESGVGVLDLVSKNGTYVNGREVESAILKRGDVIVVGETKIVFEG